jgi:hypothetical protein
MTDIERLLAGRKLVDDYRAAHASTGEHETDKLISGLKELGFASIEEFFKFNRRMGQEDAKRCTRRVGVCDFCVGRTPGCVKACYEKFSEPSKEPTPTGRTPLKPSEDLEDWTRAALYHWEWHRSIFPTRKKGVVTPMIPNCSIKNIMVEDPAFDWYWR